jgi:hypothetical protein
MRIAYNNYADSPAIVSATTAITNYPITNTQNERLKTSFRTSTLSNLVLKIDLGSVKTITVAALSGHNLTSSATVVFSAIDANPIIYSPTTEVRFVSALAYTGYILTEASEKLTTETPDYLITGTSESVVQYCYFEINDPTNPDGFIEIGRVWVGEYITIDPSSLLGFSVIKKASDIVQHTKGQQKFAIAKTGWREFNFDFPISNYVMIKQIEDMYDYCGNYKSILFCNFDDIRGYVLVEPVYCSINGNMAFKHDEKMKFEYSFSLKEER